MTKQTPRESAIVDRILSYLNGRPDCFARKRHGNPMEKRGWPDIYGAIRVPRWKHTTSRGLESQVTADVMVHYEVEVKRPGKEPTPLQKAVLAKLSRLGIPTLVAADVEDVQRFIEEVTR